MTRADDVMVKVGLLAAAVGALVAVERWTSPQAAPFLSDEPPALWVRADEPFRLVAQPLKPQLVGFRRSFTLAQEVGAATIEVRALRSFEVSLDGHVLASAGESPDGWRTPVRVSLPGPLAAGPHLVLVSVAHTGGPPALLVTSDDLPLWSDAAWEAAPLGGAFTPARLASDLPRAEVSRAFPTLGQALGRWAPGLVVALLAFGALGFLSARREGKMPKGWLMNASRFGALGAFAVLGINDALRLPAAVGFDWRAHLAYIEFIVREGRLPLATDGWQMFQAPLFYLLATPVAVLLKGSAPETVARALRVLPLLCGLGLVELCFRSARAVFGEREELVAVATVGGGLLPVSLYMSQSVGNEPLAALLMAAVWWQALELLRTDVVPRPWRTFAVLGGLWGLAILSKVTALLLGPVLALVVVHRLVAEPGRRRAVLVSALAVPGAALLVSGWYFVRNTVHLGKPFVGGWERGRGMDWWQLPGYRTAQQLTAFGEGVVSPIYAGAQGLWDSLYSTVWLDGFLSGKASYAARPPWNEAPLVASALLGVVPTALLVVALLRVGSQQLRAQRAALVLCVLGLGGFLLAIVDLYLRLPIYSTAKGSYFMGLAPAVGLLLAAGASPFLHRPGGRAVVFGLLGAWVTTAWAAYFVV